MAFFSKLTSLVSDVKGSIAAVVSENKSQFQAEELKIEDDKRKLAAKQGLLTTRRSLNLC
jgi:gas vesicle protein